MTHGNSRIDSAVSAARAWLRTNRAGLLAAFLLVALGALLWVVSPPPDTCAALRTCVRPLQPVDLAFDGLMTLRRAMLGLAPHSQAIILTAGAALWIVVWIRALRIRRLAPAISASIVSGCALLALQAQVDVMRGRADDALALYLISVGTFLVWMLVDRRRGAPFGGITRNAEIVLLVAILAVAVFGRIYDLKRVPYGVDGDESKWTIEVVATMVDGGDWLGSEYHRRYLPMSFWMEAPFHWMMGAGMTPARLEVAVVSIIATYLFYRLARELFDVPTALVATLLLGVSLADLSASRVANVESHAKLWSILPMYGIAVALRTRELRHFLLTGAAVAGAMLTYETLMPIVAATFTLAIGAALRERRAWRAWLRRVAALATAPAAVAVVTSDYLLGRMQYYQDYRTVAEAYPAGDQLLRGVRGLLDMFSAQSNADWLYYRDGPYLNGLLVPLLALGIALAVARLRHPGAVVSLAWLAWVFIPVPIVLHTPLPRILYPGLPALYLFVALALVAIGRVIMQAVQMPRLSAAVGVAGLAGFAILNLTIWFQEVVDPDDELRRREIVEIVAAKTAPDAPLLIPYVVPGEPADVERALMALMLRERRGESNTGDYRALFYRDLLPALSRESVTAQRVHVLVDTSQGILRAERQAIVDALTRCYPNRRSASTYFELYTIERAELQNPNCHSAHLLVSLAQPTPIGDARPAPVSITWSLDTASASRAELTCARSRSDLLWIEAEAFVERAGWIDDVRFVTEYSGTGYLADNPESDYAAHTIDVPAPGAYRVWIRSLRRQIDDFPAYLEMRGQTFAFGAAGAGPLGEWQWQALGDLTLEAGPLPLRMTRPFDSGRERFIALFVDALILTVDRDFDPNRDDRWQAVLQLRGLDGEQRDGVFEMQLEPGNYRCEVAVADGERLIDETGSVGLVSDPIYFQVEP